MANFKNALLSNSPVLSRTENGMKAFAGTGNALTDLFYKAGASRGVDLSPVFARAYAEDRVRALRLMAWMRDIRGGAGERAQFRTFLRWIEKNAPDELPQVVAFTPEYGRWDDLLELKTDRGRAVAFNAIGQALLNENGLCAKWMPRKGRDAVELRDFLGLTPKQYRKMLVRLSDTVEQKMCAGNWTEINFSHVPSVAAARYQKAFTKHDKERYQAYRDSLVKNLALPPEQQDKSVKINATAVYPYDVIKSVKQGDQQVALAQWAALPDYMDGSSVLGVIDVSGSMDSHRVAPNLTAMDVAVSLGLYMADKGKGPFKDVFCTFSNQPKLEVLKGDLLQKIRQLSSAHWAMSTNLHGVFDEILKVAKKHKLGREDLPQTVVIISDMQFNACVRHDDSAMEMIRRKYENAGYEIPRVVFWNVAARGNDSPARFDERGVALVSGFSPAIVKSILGNSKDFDPYNIMLKTIDSDRYNAIV